VTDPLPKKQYFRIGEVARLLDVPSHVLRYWETEFRAVRPSKSASGQRVYSRRDVERLQLIKRLLRDERYTIEGARRALKERGLDDDANAPAKPEVLRAALVHARDRLVGLLDALDALRPPVGGVEEPDMSTAPEIHVTETELEGDLAARDETA
jgi:DNA-binding transcriptional MerR regulator